VDATRHRWDDIAWDRLNPKLDRRLITGERLMLAHVYLREGCIVPEHAHENEQMTYVLEGAMRFTVGGEQVDLTAGDVLHLPSGVPHAAEALEDTLSLDVFHPPRADWLDGSDAYLRDANR
jgi:quercetin dioxygenase-like cupin family protein